MIPRFLLARRAALSPLCCRYGHSSPVGGIPLLLTRAPRPGPGAVPRTSVADEVRSQRFCLLTEAGRAQRLVIHHWLRMVG